MTRNSQGRSYAHCNLGAAAIANLKRREAFSSFGKARIFVRSLATYLLTS